MLAASKPAAVVPNEPRESTAAPEMLLRRQGAADGQVEQVPSHSRPPFASVPQAGATDRRLQARDADGTPSLSSGELARVTDEVVRAIDRRIVAERERRGGR